ncbi:hypothetical protein ACHWQZ_G002006 [Mnemiopsis leidyi]
MVDSIAANDNNKDRILERKNTTTAAPNVQTTTSEPIRVISSFGSDTDLVNVVHKYKPHLRSTQSFFEEDTQSSYSKTSSKNKSKLFQFVKKTGSTLRSGLVTSKELSLGSKHGKTEPCSKKNCKCCGMILSKETISVNGKKIKSSPGTCKTYNIVYLVKCSIC